MPFQRGNKAAKKRAKFAGGRPTKAELKEKAIRLEIWERELAQTEREAAHRYGSRSLKSDRVLIDRRKTVMPDAPQTVRVEGEITVDDLILKAVERKRGAGKSSK